MADQGINQKMKQYDLQYVYKTSYVFLRDKNGYWFWFIIPTKPIVTRILYVL